MTTSPPSLRLATADDRPAVIDTVTAAFAADPAFRHFFPDDETYAEETWAFVSDLYDRRIDLGTVWVVEDGAAVAMWESPHSTGGPTPHTVSAGARARIDTFDAAVHRLLPAQPFWYLGILATHPDHTGKRWGRLAMEQGLARARHDGLPAYLETATARNVAIYAASGWIETGSTVIEGIPLSVMEHR